MTLQEKQLKVLNETIQAYNSDNRCVVDGSSTCKYHIEGKQGCAVGRLIPDIELRKAMDNQPSTGIYNEHTFSMLPNDIKELTKEFLVSLQNLHDISSNWDANGLSDRGKKEVEILKEKYKLNLEVTI